MWSFMSKYLDELKKLKEKVPVGEVATVSENVTKLQGRPLFLGKLDVMYKIILKLFGRQALPSMFL